MATNLKLGAWSSKIKLEFDPWSIRIHTIKIKPLLCLKNELINKLANSNNHNSDFIKDN